MLIISCSDSHWGNMKNEHELAHAYHLRNSQSAGYLKKKSIYFFKLILFLLFANKEMGIELLYTA